MVVEVTVVVVPVVEIPVAVVVVDVVVRVVAVRPKSFGVLTYLNLEQIVPLSVLMMGATQSFSFVRCISLHVEEKLRDYRVDESHQ